MHKEEGIFYADKSPSEMTLRELLRFFGRLRGKEFYGLLGAAATIVGGIAAVAYWLGGKLA
jgi:hypothetical protein